MALARNIVGLLLSVLLGLYGVRISDGSFEDRQRLSTSLFLGYDRTVAPYGIAGGSVTVNHSMILNGIISLDDQVLTLKTWPMMQWVDGRLQWSPEDYNGLEELRIPSRMIWQPDIMLVNSAEQYTGFPSGDINAVVYSDGKVWFIPPVITKSYCSVDYDQLYQNNEVMCKLKFMSWTHASLNVDLKLPHNGLDIQIDNGFNKQWKAVNSSAERHTTKYSCCPEVYADIEYTLKLKRIG